MENWEATIISQYDASPTLVQLINSINQWFDPRQNIDNFYDMVWNIETAEGYGLDVWGRIVGVGRVLNVPGTSDYLGFDSALPGVTSFGFGIWYSGEPLTGNYELTDDAFRTLILAKAAANISYGSIKSINAILQALFGASGVVYCTDGLDMTMTYTFTFTPTAVQIAIAANAGVLPRSTGVALSIVTP